ncbi:MAG: hypothetical protein ACRDZ4_17085 [Egibacteraceae bacterium]
MTPVVVLVLAAMAMTVGVTLVAGLQLRRAVFGLSGRVRATAERIQPLVDELTQGTMVTTAELEALTESARCLTASRQRRPRRSR